MEDEDEGEDGEKQTHGNVAARQEARERPAGIVREATQTHIHTRQCLVVWREYTHIHTHTYHKLPSILGDVASSLKDTRNIWLIAKDLNE